MPAALKLLVSCSRSSGLFNVLIKTEGLHMGFILFLQVFIVFYLEFLYFLCFQCVALVVIGPGVSLWGAGPLFYTQLT
jgi:hypothetical protein